MLVLPGGAEVAARPGVDLDQLDLFVRVAALLHRGEPAVVRLDRLNGAAELLHQGKRLLPVQRRPANDRLGSKVDDALGGVAGRDVVQQDEGAALDRVAFGEGAHGVLGRLVEGDEGKAPAVAGLVGGGDLGGRRDFVGGQGVKGVRNADGRGGSGLGDHWDSPVFRS